MDRTTRVLAALLVAFFTLGAVSTTAVASPGADGIADHHNKDKDKDKKKDKDDEKDEDKKKDKDKDKDDEGYPM
jgi:ribosomal protein L12E/L44/L45/RPP1/RPP2